VPTAVQLKDTVEAIQARSDFGEIESFETLLRHWQVKGMSVRPHFRMIAHSAFIIVSRKLVAADSNPHEHRQEPIVAADSGEGESDGVDADEPLD
jgi:tRNA (adenine57-N1/adenine58-N1)-methyltransferase